MQSDLKVALVHDWLTGLRGGEKVLESLLELWPKADLYTLVYNQGSVSPLIENRNIYTSFIDRLPFKKNRYPYYLPLFPAAIELFNFKNYDLILSTSHCVAKGIRTPPNCLHISYIHSPMRYVWDMYEEYFAEDQTNFITSKLIPIFANRLRIWDITSSNRVDYFIANSEHVAKRIWRYYRRESTVINPPVDTNVFKLMNRSGDYFLIISALVAYKKIDLAVKTFNKLNTNLIIIGDGPEKKRLQKNAKNNIQFLPWQNKEVLNKYYASCKALIFPGEEDFGIVPVEAQSCGKPVIAYARGGALETVIAYDGTNEGHSTGIFFDEQNENALINAINTCNKLKWESEFIRKHALKFGSTRFKYSIKNFIHQKIIDFFEQRKQI
jgi:glycosyltransferase involved in cell wall biosynthesis